MALRLAQFLAIVLTALALVPAGAHLAELPNKIGLDQEAYFVVQNIYRGWALFGIALFGALAANLALAILVRRQRAPFWLALSAFLLVAATLVDLLHLDLSGKPGDEQLDGRSRQLAAAAHDLGVCARDERGLDLPGAVRCHMVRASDGAIELRATSARSMRG